MPLAGDRKFGDDDAIIGGFGRFRGESICVIGHEKGSSTETRLKHNFGMARPEGYRKAVRLMEMADRFEIPVLALVDTAGAYPGIGAEERGQAEAIARSTEACLNLGVPNVALVIGEGGSGGAIAIATANRVLMLEHAIYSVISPEGAASILWHDTTKAQEAATNMKITAQDLARFGDHRRDRPRTRRRRASRPAGRDRAGRRRHRVGLGAPEGTSTAARSARCGVTSSWRSAVARSDVRRNQNTVVDPETVKFSGDGLTLPWMLIVAGRGHNAAALKALSFTGVLRIVHRGMVNRLGDHPTLANLARRSSNSVAAGGQPKWGLAR